MNILIADKFPAHWTEELKKRGHAVTLRPELDETTLPAAVADTEVLIVRSTKVPAAVINAAARLKLIIRAGAGFDTIDFKHAAQKGVAVCNCPGTNSIAVAELTLGLLLALDRRLYHNTRDLNAGVWNKKEYSKARGLYGRTLGIIGLGHIGQEVAKRAQAFGMRLVAFDPYATADTFARLNITPMADIYTLAAASDAVTVHLPDTPQTHGLFNQKFFAALKDGATFINTARGGLVNTPDLIAAAKAKHLRVGLDVYENEPKATDNVFDFAPFADLDCFYGTHHIGASTDQAQDAVAECAVNIVDTFAQTGNFLHKVN